MKIILITIITVKMINNKTMYTKRVIDMKDMPLNKPSCELSNKQ